MTAFKQPTQPERGPLASSPKTGQRLADVESRLERIEQALDRLMQAIVDHGHAGYDDDLRDLRDVVRTIHRSLTGVD